MKKSKLVCKLQEIKIIKRDKISQSPRNQIKSSWNWRWDMNINLKI